MVQRFNPCLRNILFYINLVLLLHFKTARCSYSEFVFYNTTLVFIYLAAVSLCYNNSFLHALLFIHPEISIGIVEKRLFEFLEYSFEKIVAMEISYKSIHFGVLNSSTFASLQGVRKTTRLERFMSVLDVQKKACLISFRREQSYAHVIACFIWRRLNYLYSPFASEIYVLLNEK